MYYWCEKERMRILHKSRSSLPSKECTGNSPSDKDSTCSCKNGHKRWMDVLLSEARNATRSSVSAHPVNAHYTICRKHKLLLPPSPPRLQTPFEPPAFSWSMLLPQVEWLVKLRTPSLPVFKLMEVVKVELMLNSIGEQKHQQGRKESKVTMSSALHSLKSPNFSCFSFCVFLLNYYYYFFLNLFP